jgi:hypothetical protein
MFCSHFQSDTRNYPPGNVDVHNFLIHGNIRKGRSLLVRPPSVGTDVSSDSNDVDMLRKTDDDLISDLVVCETPVFSVPDPK